MRCLADQNELSDIGEGMLFSRVVVMGMIIVIIVIAILVVWECGIYPSFTIT